MIPVPAVFTRLPEAVKLSLIVGLFVVVIFLSVGWGVSSFTNSPTSIRRYVVADEGLSLEDKMHRASRSTLTGSRDVPVFFSDFNVEMTRDPNGDLVPVRESFSNDKVNDVANIENRFLVN
jgi:hypothetical protein